MNALRGCRVLLLEDEFFVADDIAQALALAGAEILGPFTRHAEALKAIESGLAVDLGVLDINLQGEVSFAVADRLKAEGIPFVFATGYEEASIPQSHRQAPRWEKPFRPEALAEAMAAMKAPSANDNHGL
jgi:CheY-like chemotaxis protein